MTDDQTQPDLVSAAECARRMSCSRRTLTSWIGAGCPSSKAADGSLRLDPQAVERWLSETRSAAGEPGSFDEARTRAAHWNAKLRELEYGRRRGEFVAREAVREQLGSALFQLRKMLDQIAQNVRVRHGHDVAESVDGIVESAVQELLRMWERAAFGSEPEKEQS